MESRRAHAAVLALIFLASLALKLFFLAGEPLVYNNDAGYYVEHIREVLTQGYPDVSDPPLAFYYAGTFAAVFGIMLGFKIAIALASAAIAFPAFKLAERLGGGRDAALLAAFFAAFSPTNMLMTGDLLKNAVGLFFGAWFLYYMLKASEKFSFADAAASALFAILMLGSHFSSGAFTVLSAIPFLLLVPALEWLDKSRISAESWFCISMLAVLMSGGIVIVLAKGMIGEGSIGVIGQGETVGLNPVFFTEYALFLLPALLGMTRLGRKHAMLFLPWLFMGVLLSQPLITRPDFQMRFAWDAYVPVAILTGIGLGYFRTDQRAFIGACLLVGILTLAGFVRSGLDISPIIYQEEWDGLLKLHSERPDIVFTGMSGGTGQWVAAAGFEVRDDMGEGGYLLVCDGGMKEENPWYGGACDMTVRANPIGTEGLPVVARFGRFTVLRAGEFDRREMNPNRE
jgi:hypothetical protein